MAKYILLPPVETRKFHENDDNWLTFIYITDVSSQKIREKSKNPEFLLDAVINLITEMEVDKFLSFHYSSSRIDLLWLWRRTEICYGVLFSSFVDLAGDDYSTRVQRFQIEKTMAVFLILKLINTVFKISLDLNFDTNDVKLYSIPFFILSSFNFIS